jgi:hypothetical protein
MSKKAALRTAMTRKFLNAIRSDSANNLAIGGSVFFIVD